MSKCKHEWKWIWKMIGETCYMCSKCNEFKYKKEQLESEKDGGR